MASQNPNDALLENSRRDLRGAEVSLNEKGIRTRPMWKGDHSGCDHRGRECKAMNGWTLDREGRPAPIIINMSVEKRARVVVEYDNHPSKEQESLWQAKGWVSGGEFNKGIRPAANVIEHLVARCVDELEKTLEFKQAPFETIRKETNDLREKLLASLTEPEKKPVEKVNRG